jgi:dipeptidyl aminopeptidase/acylaminoacyl peptidase
MNLLFRAPHAEVVRTFRSARLVFSLVALVVVLASGAAAPAATSARSANPGTNGHLLVASGHRHEMALYAMQPRSGDRLLLQYGSDQGASYSPDGTKIAFMNNYDGDYEICLMNADGTGVRQLTKNSATDTYPTWSPDGTEIAFASNRDGDFDIWVMNADGSQQTNITSDDPWVDDVPRWSPDGRWIAITTDRYGGVSAELITPDGTNQATIGSVQYATWFDSWSPDGKSLLVDSNRGGDYDIYRYDISGTAPLQWDLLQAKVVSDDNAVEGPAIWSPDGKQIALSSNRDGDFEVYVMNAEGGPQQQLTHNTVDDIVEDWQSLHDLRAPSVKALKSQGTMGKAITLRFKASDNSGRASVGITIFLGKHPVGYLRTPLKQRSAGHAYTAKWRSYKLKGQLRFCAEAYDPSGNESPESCAPIVTT